jgi:ArsR family transcriptional regulator
MNRGGVALTEPHGPVDPKALAAAEASLLAGPVWKRAEEILESLCDPSRLRIVQALRATPLTVSELSRVISKSRAATSQHLKVLRGVDAVTAERHGQFVVYSLSEHVNAEVLENVANAFDKLRRTA